tara:strand:+ start:1117 stop:1497 length:381 start_codon:yes stop_codon:yes gene_type:complete
MSNIISAPIYGRTNGTATALAVAGKEVQMVVPIRGIIKRVQAYKVSGAMVTFNLVTIRATTGATAGLNVIAEYGTGSAFIDSEESIFYSVPEEPSTPGRGIIYFFVTANTGINSEVATRLDIQVVQ